MIIIIAGWSSLVARRAHNPKVAGSNPVPATNYVKTYYGDCGEVVNAPDCGSGIRGFDSHQSPHHLYIGL
jgi:hypothetical protein